MKSFIHKAIHNLSQYACVQGLYKGKGVILMLHRIAPFEHRLAPNENMKVSPVFLESFILQAKAQGYTFISIDEVYRGLCEQRLVDKFICITIDDGYKDNLTYGYPIFSKHNVPFCIYVCTSFPQGTHNMWWFGLEDYLLKENAININGNMWDISSIESKEAAFMALREIIIQKVSSYEDCAETMQSLGIAYNPRDYDNLTLTWEDIDFLSTANGGGGIDRICTIGCHTHSHPIFNNLSHKQVTADIQKANALFKAHLGEIPKHFAYPFGGRIEVDSSYFPLMATLGFKTATTTRHGCIYPSHKAHLHALPRVFFSQHFNIESAYKIRKKRVVTS
ncbi:polysaccharide deacetylase [Helicobacter jaachi]|uniref:Polysaccharide deacetylase n=1 Tax=Helicobacter jaachi TaxID=1677920 RepID=A0A4U8T8W7_9HELI|nr:polysaccharide deacetylase family protein [Helicobacter jaachi]TLD96186.1 polysaccharide deacetylase [Helicobacter jaachi]